MKSLLLDYAKLGSGDNAALKPVVAAFEKSGATVTASDAPTGTKRQAGVTFRQANFTFADSQTVTLSIKQTGDIFEILVNGKKFAIKDQENHDAAVQEIVKQLDKTRSAFQKSLNKAKATLPSNMKTAIVKKEVALQEKIANLDQAISDGQALINERKAKLEQLNNDIALEVAKQAA